MSDRNKRPELKPDEVMMTREQNGEAVETEVHKDSVEIMQKQGWTVVKGKK